jgi:hypothetical protein
MSQAKEVLSNVMAKKIQQMQLQGIEYRIEKERWMFLYPKTKKSEGMKYPKGVETIGLIEFRDSQTGNLRHAKMIPIPKTVNDVFSFLRNIPEVDAATTTTTNVTLNGEVESHED